MQSSLLILVICQSCPALGGTISASTANSQVANSGGSAAAGSPGTGSPASDLQSENKALVSSAAAQAMQNLVKGMKAKLNSGATLIFNAPLTPTQAISVLEMQRQLNELDDSFSKPPATEFKERITELASKVDSQKRDILGRIAKAKGLSDKPQFLPDTSSGLHVLSTLGSISATGTPVAAPALGELGADSTQVGMITDAIDGALTLVARFHSTMSVAEGSVSLDQDTLNSLFATQVGQDDPKYGLFDYEQALPLTVNNYENCPFFVSFKNFEKAQQNWTTANKVNLVTQKNVSNEINDLANQIKDLENKTFAGQLDLRDQLQADANTISAWSATAQSIDADLAAISSSSAALIQSLTGAPQSEKKEQPTAKSDPSATAANADKNVTINLSVPAATNPSQTNQGSLSDTFVDSLAKFCYLSSLLEKLNQASQGNSKPYLVTCGISVSDATQTKVERFLLEDYVALSGTATVRLQLLNLATGKIDYANREQINGYQIYWQSRVRDEAEEWSTEDTDSGSKRTAYVRDPHFHGSKRP